MRVCFDISPALGQGAGVGRYARELALALQRLPDAPDLIFYHNRQPLDRLPAAFSKTPRIQIPLDNKTWRIAVLAGLCLPQFSRGPASRCQLLHGTDIIVPVTACPAVVTIHDLSSMVYPQHHTLAHRTFLRFALPIMLRRGSRIIADSEATRQDLIKCLRISPSKAVSIPLGVDHARFRPLDVAKASENVGQMLGIETPYILSLGTVEPRKNLPSLIRAYSTLGEQVPPLVIAGAKGWGDTDLPNLLRSLRIDERVQLIGYIPEAILPDLYSAASLFVYPSLYEGFGLPVLEAMACGTPVITSNVSSLPEVAGDAALLVDARNVNQLASAMQRLIDDGGLRLELGQKGLARAASFTWERTARATASIYSSVLGY